MVNDIYSIVLSNEYSLGDNSETELAQEIISKINLAELNEGVVSEEILDKFVLFEGKRWQICSHKHLKH